MTLRLIEGGRDSADAPGLLIHGASQVATLAGGLRRGARQGDLALLDADDGRRTGRAGSARGRVLGGPDRRGRAARPAWSGAWRSNGYSMARFVRLDADGGVVTPGLVDPAYPPAVRGDARGRARPPPAGRRVPGDPRGGRRDPVHGRRDAGRLHGGARRARPPLAGRDGRATASPRSRRSPAMAWTCPTELRLLEVAFQLGREGPVDVVPTFLGAHAVPPEYRTRSKGTEAYVRSVIEEQLPSVAAQGRATSCDVFCEQGVFSADQSRRILQAAAGYGLALRLHADELAPSGGAELAAELGALSADHLHAPSDAGIAALAAAAAGPRPTVATLLPGTTWFLMADDAGPGAPVHRRGRAGRAGDGLQPRHVAEREPAAGHDHRLPRDEALAGGGPGGRDGQRRACRRDRATRPGRWSRAGSRTWSSGARRPSSQLPYWVGADLVEVVVKRGRVVYRRGT